MSHKLNIKKRIFILSIIGVCAVGSVLAALLTVNRGQTAIAAPASTEAQKHAEPVYTTPQTKLPQAVSDHLSSYQSRLKTVSSLPLTQANDAAGKPRSIEGDNVLFINPSLGYAVKQFTQVWPQLTKKPVVVWTNTTPELAKKEWAALGYHGDPLPDAVNLYSTASIPVPDAYHRDGKAWTEMPGILRDSETDKWQHFFK
ncbi:hypothetical protein [Alicyclobacillus macrosporangiidus]|uniref:Uncharacterized protein n=1 Tax=Alicyclobacillus macrosporangiidus TaxID=392015 RepID=A0A1I7L269_9BACL|nr:hypothetical protein [Alicyclobacillus macrosporangiidus]SFV03735.1 hypothetical protein SAMN05421543_12327 [Alicyclobacillus macrosporangiidus]